MEQHPVPQNVTSFQFKLIGDITLKQFAYLAGGAILAYISIKFTLMPSILRFPMAALFALLGFGLAFVPIEELPLDRWLTAFIRRIYSPTQFVWRKQNAPPEFLLISSVSLTHPTPAVQTQPQVPTAVSNTKLAREFVSTLPQASPLFQTPPPLKSPPKPVVPPLPKAAQPKPKPIPPPPPAPPDRWTIGAPPLSKTKLSGHPPPLSDSQVSITGKRIVFKAEEKPVSTARPDPKQVEKLKSDYQAAAQKLGDQIQSLQKELQQGTIAKDRFMELQQVLTQLVSEKEHLSKELVDLRKKISTGPQSTIERPSAYATVPQDTKTTVKIVSPQIAKVVGIPKLTTQPNVVTGIIKDSRGTLLPNLIVTVKDKEGVPLRALKTNKLGQFAASTPLEDGVYMIEVEDPKKTYRFNRIEVSLTGQVQNPLEISAISEKDLMRQKLTQEIFGKNNI